MPVGRQPLDGLTQTYSTYLLVDWPADGRRESRAGSTSGTAPRVSALHASVPSHAPLGRPPPPPAVSSRHLMNFCTPGDCFSLAHPYFIAFCAACLRYAVLTMTLYSSLPSLPRVRTTVSCSLPTLKPSCLDAAAAGLAYWGNPYLNVTLLSLPALNSSISTFAAMGDFTRQDIWSFVLRPNARVVRLTWFLTEAGRVEMGSTSRRS
mmetsp:Transcript_9933/g.43303  ORF Transcript_9933/g.43303 Transcript_9933/m.43303 type:complete len:207 (-) Transcript_9933:89-709(-)